MFEPEYQNTAKQSIFRLEIIKMHVACNLNCHYPALNMSRCGVTLVHEYFQSYRASNNFDKKII